MEKFMLIVREDLETIGKLTEEERFSNIPMMLEWVDSLIESGNYIKGGKSSAKKLSAQSALMQKARSHWYPFYLK